MELLEQAIVNLLLRPRGGGVFYASLLSQMRRIEDPKVGTAGVGVQGGRLILWYNPEFLQKLTPKELLAVLEHECMHLVMNHLKRLGTRHMTMWNLATDLAINQKLSNLPKDCITMSSFPKEWGLKPDRTSEEYYDIIAKNSPTIELKQNADGSTTATMKDSKGNTIGEVTIDKTGTHEKWADKEGDGELLEEVVKQAVKEAAEQTERQQGTLPSGLEEYIKDLLRPAQLPWQYLLRKYIAASIKAGQKNSWKKPSRRFGVTQKGHLPDRIVAITLAIDTSGSISETDFQNFISEIHSIQKCYKSNITVLECDAKVQKEYKLSPHKNVDTHFKGRGGTDFTPIFDYVKEKSIKTDVLVYFTDMYGTFPKLPPKYNVIWVNCDNRGWGHKDKAPFGKVLDINKKEDK